MKNIFIEYRFLFFDLDANYCQVEIYAYSVYRIAAKLSMPKLWLKKCHQKFYFFFPLHNRVFENVFVMAMIIPHLLVHDKLVLLKSKSKKRLALNADQLIQIQIFIL